MTTGQPAGIARIPAGKKAAHATDASTTSKIRFNTSVFINCPFDEDYLPLLHALLFTIHDCGFVARTALEDNGSAEQRIAKICRLIRDSRLSIHDISRIALTQQKYPRFNMPFEAGIAYGAITFGTTRGRDMLVLESEPYEGQITLSDLAGTDPRSHRDNPAQAVAAVRAFLQAKKTSGGRTRGAQAILKRHARFTAQLPAVAAALEIDIAEIQSFDYLNDWLQAMFLWLVDN